MQDEEDGAHSEGEDAGEDSINELNMSKRQNAKDLEQSKADFPPDRNSGLTFPRRHGHDVVHEEASAACHQGLDGSSANIQASSGATRGKRRPGTESEYLEPTVERSVGRRAGVAVRVCVCACACACALMYESACAARCSTLLTHESCRVLTEEQEDVCGEE